MEGTITMSKKEARRAQVMEHVMTERITLREASTFLGVGYRQAKWIKSRYQGFGLAGVVHGNRGRRSANQLSVEMREKVRELYQGKYFDSNDTHFTELLQEREGINLGRETVRKILRQGGIKPKRRRRHRRHHSRRARKEQRGMMMLWDGSPHRWFGEDYPPCCLMSAIDDATGELLAAVFVPAESSSAYLQLLEMVCHRQGIPLSVYQDRHSALIRTDDYWSCEEQLQGYQYPTHVGLVLELLGVTAIAAHSPQAKGRVERPFGVLQDRLIVELRLEGIHEMDAANQWLQDVFIKRYNTRFSVKPTQGGSAFQKITKRNLYNTIAFHYEAIVANDNCVRLGGLMIDIPPGEKKRGFAKCAVVVKQHTDGKWSVWFNHQKIATHAATPFIEPVRQWRKRDNQTKRTTLVSSISSMITHRPRPPF